MKKTETGEPGVQTILGAGGPLGIGLAKALREYAGAIRLVSRHPKKVNESDSCVTADLLNRDQVMHAVEGSSVVYLVAGLPYSARAWQEMWPPLIRNVVEACTRHRARLVFFDNIYTIGGDNVRHITEDSPVSPTSKKGEIRLLVEKTILEAIDRGSLMGIIARSPDFFGPDGRNSVLMISVCENLMKGRKAQWFCNAHVRHSFGYIPDLARGTAILGNTPGAFNQIWNLPVDPVAPTGEEWIRMFAAELHSEAGYRVIPSWALLPLGMFIPVLKEFHEMRYQYDRDYVFDSTKFRERFSYRPKTNEEAVRETIRKMRS